MDTPSKEESDQIEPEIQALQDEASGAIDFDVEDEIEELHNSLKEVVQDPSVKPKLQCLMVDPSFSMVTVQSEDSGIVWETASSRCSTPWASEGSSPSDSYSLESSGAQGKITVIMEEERIVRKRKKSGRSKLGERYKRPGSRTAAYGTERPAMAEVSVPNVRSENDATAELKVDKDEEFFSLISEGYEILNIVVPSKLPTVDEEEAFDLMDNLSYLQHTPKIKSKSKPPAAAAGENFALIIETEIQETDEEKNQAEAEALEHAKKEGHDDDYLEKFKLVDSHSPKEQPSPAEVPPEQDNLVQEPEEVKPQEKLTPKPSPAIEDSFVMITDDEIENEHLDEVFYANIGSMPEETKEDDDDTIKGEPRSLKESGSALFGSQETILVPIYLPEGPPKIIDQCLLEEPRALSFLYSDLYDEVIGSTRRRDEDHSDVESVVSEKSYKRRFSDDEEDEGYLEKFILKDETQAVEAPPEIADDAKKGDRIIWPQNKFEMTGCLKRADEEEEDSGEKKTEVPPTEAVDVSEVEQKKDDTKVCVGDHCEPCDTRKITPEPPASVNVSGLLLEETVMEIVKHDEVPEKPKKLTDTLSGKTFREEPVKDDIEVEKSVPVEQDEPEVKSQVEAVETVISEEKPELPLESEVIVAEPEPIKDEEEVQPASAVSAEEDKIESLSQVPEEQNTDAIPEEKTDNATIAADVTKEEDMSLPEVETENLKPDTTQQEVVTDTLLDDKSVPVEEPVKGDDLTSAAKDEIEATEAELPVESPLTEVQEQKDVTQDDVVDSVSQDVIQTLESVVEPEKIEESEAVQVDAEEIIKEPEHESVEEIKQATEKLAETEELVVEKAEEKTETSETCTEKVDVSQVETDIICDAGEPKTGKDKPSIETLSKEKAINVTVPLGKMTIDFVIQGVNREMLPGAAVELDKHKEQKQKRRRGKEGDIPIIEVVLGKVPLAQDIVTKKQLTASKPDVQPVALEIKGGEEPPEEVTAVQDDIKQEPEVSPESVAPQTEVKIDEQAVEESIEAVEKTIDVVSSAEPEMAQAQTEEESKVPTEVDSRIELTLAETEVTKATVAPEQLEAIKPDIPVSTVEDTVAEIPSVETEGPEVITVEDKPSEIATIVDDVVAEISPVETLDKVLTVSHVETEMPSEESVGLEVVPPEDKIANETTNDVAEIPIETPLEIVIEESKIVDETISDVAQIPVEAPIEVVIEENKVSDETISEVAEIAIEPPGEDLTLENKVSDTTDAVVAEIPPSEAAGLEVEVGENKTVRTPSPSAAPALVEAEEVTAAEVQKEPEPAEEPVEEVPVKEPEVPVEEPKPPVEEPEAAVEEVPVQEPEPPVEEVLVKEPEALVEEPEAPVEKVPVAEPVVEAPVKEPEAPVKEEPVVEAPVKEPEAPVQEPEPAVLEPEVPVEEPEAPVEEVPVKEPEPPVEEPVEEAEAPVFSPLRSFSPQEDLSALSEAGRLKGLEFLDKTAEELDYEMVTQQEAQEETIVEEEVIPEKEEDEGLLEEDISKALEEKAAEEGLEADYEIVEASESNQLSEEDQAKMQAVDAFCLVCQCPVLMLEEHKNHEVCSLDKAYEDLKDKLSNWISTLQERTENIEDMVSEIEMAYNTVEENCKTGEQAMDEQNEEMLKLVMDQYNEMSHTMEEEKKAKLEKLYDQIVSFQESIDVAKEALGTETQEEDETDPLTFVSTSKDINLSLGKALESTMSMELSTRGLSVFDDYAKGSGNGQKHRKGIPVPQKPRIQPQEANSATGTSVTVYWTVSEEDIIDCFQVYCMEDPQGAASDEYRVTVKESYCTLEELDPDKCYKVWVMAVNYTGCSLPSERLSFKTAPSVPVIQPEQCSVLWDSATLRWACEQPSAAESFTLEYCRQYACEGEGLRSISGIKGFEQSVLLQPSENYLFYIKAVNSAGASEQSEAALISTRGTRFHMLKETASPALRLSEDKTTVLYSQDSFSEMASVNECPTILGELLPAKGYYYWETVVSGCPSYRLGVAYSSSPADSLLGENSTSWCLHCVPAASSCRFELLHNSVQTDIFVVDVPARVGTLLDFSQGRLVFFNAQNGHLLASTQQRFTEPCHAAFGLESAGSLTLPLLLEVPEFARHC